MSEPSTILAEWQARSVSIRSRTAEAITLTDRIEIYLLDPVCDVGNWGSFPLHPYGRCTGIHDLTVLEGELAAHFLALWVNTLRDDEGPQAHCHYPIHGLRFFQGESVVYETSLCWVCKNYYAEAERGYVWLGLPGGYPNGPLTSSCDGVRQILEALLPIPESLVQKVWQGRTTNSRNRDEEEDEESSAKRRGRKRGRARDEYRDRRRRK
jgi:hypothetical protein